MPYGLYISAEGAKAQAERLEMVANNLANVNTPGFKRDVGSFQARFSEAIQQGEDVAESGTENNISGGVKLIEVGTDFANATLRSTGLPTDMAVNGEGFFQVRHRNGETLLTRAGNFTIDPTGRLINQTGELALLDEGGSEIQIDPQSPWSILPGGVIDQDGQQFSIGLKKPQSLGDLVKVGANSFRSLAPVESVAEGQRDIRQGYLEMSGVSATTEMMTMIETTRAFEANTKLIQHRDGMLSQLLSTLNST